MKQLPREKIRDESQIGTAISKSRLQWREGRAVVSHGMRLYVKIFSQKVTKSTKELSAAAWLCYYDSLGDLRMRGWHILRSLRCLLFKKIAGAPMRIRRQVGARLESRGPFRP